MAMISVKKCEHCGKTFPTNRSTQEYCSKKCRIEARRLKSETKGQLCWKCENACAGCSWSKNLIPVVGWDAVRVVVKDSMGDFDTYRIKKCPQFIHG